MKGKGLFYFTRSPQSLRMALVALMFILAIGILVPFASAAPVITGIAPVTGSTSGGTSVIITGSGFTGATSVTFGPSAGTLTVNSDTQITATTPIGSLGTVDVNVTTPAGTFWDSQAFTYVSPPTVTSVLPAAGSPLGGTSVTIIGTNLIGANAVTFGGTTATSFNIVNATAITAGTPLHASGLVTVNVTTPNGTAIGTGTYTYNAAPIIASLNVTSGTVAGGTPILISGTGFTGATGVTFGSNAATNVSVAGDTSISVLTPPNAAGAVNVGVITPNGTATRSSAYTYTAIPALTVSSYTPPTGPTYGGNTITIWGANLGSSLTAANVTIGGNVATITVANNTALQATAPAHVAGSVNLVISNANGTVTKSYLYTAPVLAPVNLATAGNYEILAKSGITTTPGTHDTSITGDIAVSPIAATAMTGFNLSLDPSATFSTSSLVNGKVWAADYAAPTPATLTTAVNDMQAAYTTASGQTPNLTLSSGSIDQMTFATGVYYYAGAVSIPNNVTLSGGPNDVWIFIANSFNTGANSTVILTGGAQAKNVFWVTPGVTSLGANSVFNGNILDATSITMGNGATLNGRALAQTAVTLIGDTLTSGVPTPTPAPAITSITPTTGSTLGGTVVTISGTNLSGATVTFGGTAGTITANTATSITATTPAHAKGSAPVVVTTSGGTATGTYAYTAGSAPAVNLATAGNYEILAESGITTTPGTQNTNITGDIAVSPIAATSMTGFGLVMDSSGQFSRSSLVNGKVWAANYAAPTPATLTTAVNDMYAAYTTANAQLPSVTDLGAGSIDGMTLAPGVYKWNSGVNIPNNVTLSGNSTAVWIFQISGVLSTGAGSQVILTGGAQAQNVYWVVAGNTALGANSNFNGNILDATYIALDNGATLNGKALAQTAVTLIGDTLSSVTPTPSVTSTVGVFRNGVFYLKNTNAAGNADLVFPYGAASDTPLSGDWTGQGMDTVGVFRQGVFYLKNTNAAGNADLVFPYGAASDKPLVGDWTGQGKDTVGVFRQGVFYLKNSNSAGNADNVFTYGAASDIPVVWEHNGMDTVGVFRQGVFYLKNSNSAGNADLVFPYGAASDIPLMGYWI